MPRNPNINIVITGDAKVDDVFNAVKKAMDEMAAKAGQVSGQMQGHMATSLDGVRLLSQEFGLKLPRALEAMISRMPALSKAISGVLGGLAGLAIGEVGFRVGKEVYDLYRNWLSVDGAVERYEESLKKAADAGLTQFDSLETAKLRLQELSVEVTTLQTKSLNFWERLGIVIAAGFRPEAIQAMKDAGKAEQDAQAKGEKLPGLATAAQKEEHEFNVRQINDHKALASALATEAQQIEIRRKAARELADEELRYQRSISPGNPNRVAPQGAQNERNRAVRQADLLASAELQKSALEQAQRTAKDHTATLIVLAEQESAREKEIEQGKMATLEALHKQQLVSGETFYKERLAIQQRELDSEQTAVEKRLSALDSQYQRQRKDPRLRRDAQGVSSEELTTRREMLELQGKLADIEAKRGVLRTQEKADEAGAEQKSFVEELRRAADIEAQRNTGLTARIALMRAELEIRLAQIASSDGADSPEYKQAQQLEQIQEAKLRIAEVDKQIRDAEENQRIAVERINAALGAGLKTKSQAEREIKQVDAEAAQIIGSLLPMYKEQADFLGGEYTKRVKDLTAETYKLQHPAKDGGFGDAKKALTTDLTGSVDTFIMEVGRSKSVFTDFADSVLRDIERMLAKMFEQLILQKALSSLFGFLFGGGGVALPGLSDLSGSGGMLPGFAAGGSISGPAIVGEKGPELFVPKVPGTIVPTSRLQGMLAAGDGKAPNIQLSVVNNSSAAVSPTSVGVTYDTQQKQYVIGVVLEDLQNGGALAAAMGGR